jgi:hypothetical protein
VNSSFAPNDTNADLQLDFGMWVSSSNVWFPFEFCGVNFYCEFVCVFCDLNFCHHHGVGNCRDHQRT